MRSPRALIPQAPDGLALAPTYMAYPDPIEPQVNLADFLHLRTIELNGQTATWASGVASPPSQRQLRWELPPVGLLSRIYIDVDGGTATAYDFTAGGGTGAPAALGDGPYGVVDNVGLKINGGVAVFDVSGFGAMLLEAAESTESLPQTQGVGVVYTTAPTDIESTIFNYPGAADGRPRWGISVPLSLTPGNPLGMILAGNDQTSIELVLTLTTLDRYALLAGGGTATLTLTFIPTVELFDVPEPAAFGQYVRPMLDWAHVCREWRQDITGTGEVPITLDNHDNILQIIHTTVLNGTVNTDALDRGRFLLNRGDYRYDDRAATHWRRQRRVFGKDIPAWAWTFFATKTLRDAIRADSYTDIRSMLTIAAGTTLGTAYFRTAERRLIQLDQRAG